jgi:predicted nuclease of predicted toxin-antitoxin system
MRFIADENIPLRAVLSLKEAGIDIISITEMEKGLKDEEIVQISERERAVIITFDRDFGEIVFRLSLKAYGLILLRITPKSADYITDYLKWLLLESKLDFEGKFIVAKEDRIREINMFKK